MKKLMTVVLAMLFAASTSVVFAAEGKGDAKKAEAKDKKAAPATDAKAAPAKADVKKADKAK